MQTEKKRFRIFTKIVAGRRQTSLNCVKVLSANCDWHPTDNQYNCEWGGEGLNAYGRTEAYWSMMVSRAPSLKKTLAIRFKTAAREEW